MKIYYKYIKLILSLNSVGSLIQTADFVLEVVAYEARRLFRDRIVGTKELQVFDSILTSVFQGDWGSDVLDNMAGKPFEVYHRNLKYLFRKCLVKFDSI